MLYVGYQVTPAPGKLNDLLGAHQQLKDMAQAHGATQVGGFQVEIGPDAGSLFYIVSYPDADAYMAASKAFADSAVMQEAQAWIACASSAALRPLPGSALQ